MSRIPEGESSPPTSHQPDRSLLELLQQLPAFDETLVVYSGSTALTFGQLRAAVAEVATGLRRAGVRRGSPVAGLVGPGALGVIAMFAVWQAGGVYLPVNRRYTAQEVAKLTRETPIDVLLGTAEDLDRIGPALPAVGLVEVDETTWRARLRRPVGVANVTHDDGVALILRTSGTTGRPKAVALRHASTIDALDSSLRKLRRRASAPRERRSVLRVNLIPLSMALWSGIFNTLFSLRAGFGVVLLEQLTPAELVHVIRTHKIKSTVLPPAMITMLVESTEITSLAPLEIVRSITAPLSPAVARQFYERFGVLVLNSYGQTELGGEVVGWTVADIRTFGMTKLGAVGRPYDDVDVRIVDDEGRDLGPDDVGHILIRSPFRMRGYVTTGDSAEPNAEDRLVDGFLRTGDIGRLDADGFLWIEGRVSDMINRGGLKVFPDEVEEVLRRHPSVRDVAVAGVTDRRLGEVPYAWVVPAEGPIDPDTLAGWCRRHLAPYKVPVTFIEVSALPRSETGKVLRRELQATVTP